MPVLIAIDGPAASGKSSVARQLAARFDFVYVNTGEMYRAATWLVTSRGVNPEDPAAVAACLRGAEIDCVILDGISRVRVDGVEPGDGLRSKTVNDAVSPVSAVPEVREKLVRIQREFALAHDVVMEGRDIGTVVCPSTPYKIYIDASPEVRAKRRAAEGFQDQVTARDRLDSARKNSPLAVAADADVIDTTEMNIEEVLTEVLARLRQRGLRVSPVVS